MMSERNSLKSNNFFRWIFALSMTDSHKQSMCKIALLSMKQSVYYLHSFKFFVKHFTTLFYGVTNFIVFCLKIVCLIFRWVLTCQIQRTPKNRFSSKKPRMVGLHAKSVKVHAKQMKFELLKWYQIISGESKHFFFFLFTKSGNTYEETVEYVSHSNNARIYSRFRDPIVFHLLFRQNAIPMFNIQNIFTTIGDRSILS